MHAMILAAGIGKRLKPLTEKIPKALVKVGGVPMLGRCIEFLKRARVDSIVVNIHHFPDMIARYLEDLMEYHEVGVSIRWIFEPELLETAGGIANAREFLHDTEPVIVMNCDILTDFDLAALYQFHIQKSLFATLAVKQRPTDRPYLVDSSGRVVGHRNKKTGIERIFRSPGEAREDAFFSRERVGSLTSQREKNASLVSSHRNAVFEYGFCGVEVVSQAFLDFLIRQETKGISLTEIHLQAANQGQDIRIFDIGDAAWFDIGTQGKLAAAEAWFHSAGASAS